MKNDDMNHIQTIANVSGAAAATGSVYGWAVANHTMISLSFTGLTCLIYGISVILNYRLKVKIAKKQHNLEA